MLNLQSGPNNGFFQQDETETAQFSAEFKSNVAKKVLI